MKRKATLLSHIAVGTAAFLAGCAGTSNTAKPDADQTPVVASAQPGDVLPFSNKASVNGMVGEQTRTFGANVRQFASHGLSDDDRVGVIGGLEGSVATGTFFNKEDENVKATNASGRITLGLYNNRASGVTIAGGPDFRIASSSSNAFLEKRVTLQPGARLLLKVPYGSGDHPATSLTADVSLGYQMENSSYDRGFDGKGKGLSLQIGLLEDLWAHTDEKGRVLRKLSLQETLGYSDVSRNIDGTINGTRYSADEDQTAVALGGALIYHDRENGFYLAPFGNATFANVDRKGMGVKPNDSATTYLVGIEGGLDLAQFFAGKDRDYALMLSVTPFVEGGNRQKEGAGVAFGISLYDAMNVGKRLYRLARSADE